MGVSSGEEFAGYRIERELARGGMGVVYLARDIRLDRLVALKLLGTDLGSDEDYRARFRRESRTAASIDHPNVVAVYEAREHEGELYLVMQYVPGHDLRTEIRRRGRLPAELAAKVVGQAADGLDEVHAAGLVHRDVKPANILLHSPDEQVRALITDFGISRSQNATTMTATGLFVGTLDYVAPEQLQGQDVDARSDVYALGCALYEAISGEVPYPAEDGPSKMFAHVHGDPPTVAAGLGPAAKRLEAVIARAMAKNPQDRFPSAGDMGRAAIEASAGRPPPNVAERIVGVGDAAPVEARAAPPPRPVPPPPPPSPSAASTVPLIRSGEPVSAAHARRMVLGVGLLIGLAAAVAAVLLLSSGGSDDSPAQRLSAADARWSATTGGPILSTPAVSGGTLIVGSDEGSVLAYDAAKGQQQWRVSTGGEVRSSPAVAGGNAYVGSFDGNVYSLRASDGRQRWAAPTGYEVFSSPAVSGDTVVVGARGVVAFDPDSGAQRWSFDTGGPVNSSPAIADGVVYVGADDGSVYALELGSGRKVWRQRIGGPVNSSPTVFDGVVYVGSGEGMFALGAENGETRWKLALADGVNSSPVVSGGAAFFGARDGNVYALDASSGEMLWSFAVGDRVDSSPIVDSGIVYIGANDGTVYGLEAGTGEERWSFAAGAPVIAAPVVSGGVIYVATDEGSVFALDRFEG